MLIGQLSRKTGFSRDTIRFYEKIGLIVLPKKSTPKNTYKDYPDEIAHQLEIIRKYKDLGFTLEEIREILVRRSMKLLDLTKMLQIIDTKITGIDEQIDQLHELKMRLNREQQMLLHKKTGHTIFMPELKVAA